MRAPTETWTGPRILAVAFLVLAVATTVVMFGEIYPAALERDSFAERRCAYLAQTSDETPEYDACREGVLHGSWFVLMRAELLVISGALFAFAVSAAVEIRSRKRARQD